MTHVPPPAEELRLLDAELWQLDARRAQLLHRRAWLVTALQQVRPVDPEWKAPVGPPRPEATTPSVQNVLLLLGGVLLTVAAMVFTLVSWGHLGIAGRALVLGAVTLAALGAPLLLLKRGLRSTAESVAGLGLALTVLDAYAVQQVAFTGTDGAGYAAIASALLAALWSAYGLLPRAAELRLPLPAALAAAQLPLLLWAIAADAGPYGITAALLVTAGLDTGVALRVSTHAVRVLAALGAYGMGAWGALAAGWLSWGAAGPSAAARAAALFILAAAIALGAAWRLPKPAMATGNAVAGCLFLVAAAGGVLRVTLPEGWTVPAYLACGVALLAAVRVRLPEPVRRGVVQASGAVQAAAVACALPLVAVALLGPLGWASGPWSGVPSDARAAVTVHTPWPSYPGQLLLGPVVVAAVLALLVREPVWRPRALIGATVLAWATVMAVPAVLQLPYVTALLIQGAAIVTALAAAAFRPLPLPPTVLALGASASLAFLSLASQTATLTVLAALTAVFAAASLRPHLAPVTAPASLVYAAALACATGAAAGWQEQHTALLVLAVPVAAALLAARLGESHARVPIEVTGAAAGLLAIGLAVADPPMLALVLALCAVIAAGTAVRPERRRVQYAAAVLFLLATWVRLAAWDVGTVEAYTLPVTVPALCVGALRRNRDPLASSWTAYGPGLAATLLPSLAAAWNDPHFTRPLLLGAAALVVTLLGARHRLQAPLVLGGSVLVLDALHELAPYLVQMTGALPRWVPPALAGLLLLALGATYERRIRDVRRVRDLLGTMR
ncbi:MULTISPECIES: SCO7613 C-terminal domain-containing membrane protein [unclassified Streptomyces]|uniref:SCO7613 C-terminal domain-containing membrane protein n=1 Tax=unclassified Streptomyces TaxID=2593676 RepID=UPI0032568CA6